ncbi:RNA recognition motif domain-containing protein [Melioribacteraceae bacterium 4301-Me]|uniref:RNA recognition motif domain-containing protein n=1 Tax=Pyranulibacter aquaticus TaxID=3163344 RepID=UPI00359A1F23
MNIYIGNLSPQVTDQELKDLFNEYGLTQNVKIIRDIFTGDSKGFGFVEMNDKSAALKAIEALNAKELKGKKIVVNEARPKNDKKRGGGRGGNYGSNKRRW